MGSVRVRKLCLAFAASLNRLRKVKEKAMSCVSKRVFAGVMGALLAVLAVCALWSAEAGAAGPARGPAPPAPPDWQLLFWDDFGDPLSGWYLGPADSPMARYHEGMLQVGWLAEPNKSHAVVAARHFNDFRADVDVQYLGPDEQAIYGLVLRHHAAGHRYEFRVTPQGAYQVLARVGENDQVELQPWTASACIQTGVGSVNHLTAVAEGTRMSFWVNGCFLTEITDARHMEGEVGLTVSRLEAPRAVDVRFDNFRVYSSGPGIPVAYGTPASSPDDPETLKMRGEYLALDPYPVESVAQYPAGTKKIYFYVPYVGMSPERDVTEVLLIDGNEAWREGPVPWSLRVEEQNQLALGVLARDFKMKQGGPLPTGHWEVRWYVDDVPVARAFVNVGVEGPAPTPAPLATTTLPPVAPRPLPRVEEALRRADELCAQKQWTQALGSYQEVLVAMPDSVQALASAGTCYAQAGQPGWAQMLQTTARNFSGEGAPEQVRGSRPQASSPTPEGAQPQGRPPVQGGVVQQGGPAQPAEGQDGDTCLIDVKGAYNERRYEDAVTLFDQCLAQGGAAGSGSYEYLGRARYWIGLEQSGAGRFSLAIEALNRAVALDPRNANAYDYLGRIYYFEEDYDQAQSHLKQAQALDPELPDPYYFQARVLYLRKEYQEAIPFFERYLEMGQAANRGNAFKYLGYCRLALNWRGEGEDRFADALAALEQALSLLPEDELVYFYFGQVYHRLGQHVRALLYLDKTLELDPEETTAYYYRGYSRFKAEMYEDAIVDFQALLEREAGARGYLGQAYTYMGWSYYKLKQYDRAESAFRQAQALDDSPADAYGGLGWVYADTGRCAEAVPHFQKAVEMEPSFDGWKTGLGKCQGNR